MIIVKELEIPTWSPNSTTPKIKIKIQRAKHHDNWIVLVKSYHGMCSPQKTDLVGLLLSGFNTLSLSPNFCNTVLSVHKWIVGGMAGWQWLQGLIISLSAGNLWSCSSLEQAELQPEFLFKYTTCQVTMSIVYIVGSDGQFLQTLWRLFMDCVIWFVVTYMSLCYLSTYCTSDHLSWYSIFLVAHKVI